MQIAAVMSKFMQYIKVLTDLILLAVTQIPGIYKKVPFCARPLIVTDTRWMCSGGARCEHPA